MTRTLVKKTFPDLYPHLKDLNKAIDDVYDIYIRLEQASPFQQRCSLSSDDLFWEIAFYELSALFSMRNLYTIDGETLYDMFRCVFRASSLEKGISAFQANVPSEIGNRIISQLPLLGYILCCLSSELVNIASSEGTNTPFIIGDLVKEPWKLPHAEMSEIPRGRSSTRFETILEASKQTNSLKIFKYLVLGKTDANYHDAECLNIDCSRHKARFYVPCSESQISSIEWKGKSSGNHGALAIRRAQGKVKGVCHMVNTSRRAMWVFLDILASRIEEKCSFQRDGRSEEIDEWLYGFIETCEESSVISLKHWQDVLVQAIENNDVALINVLSVINPTVLVTPVSIAKNTMEGCPHVTHVFGEIMHPSEVAIVLEAAEALSCILGLSLREALREASQSEVFDLLLRSSDSESEGDYNENIDEYTNLVLSNLGMTKEDLYDILIFLFYKDADFEFLEPFFILMETLDQMLFNFHPRGRPPLIHVAIKLGLKHVVQKIAAAGGSVAIRYSNLTPLLAAAKLSDIHIIRVLVANGAFVNTTDKHGRDVLYYLRNISIDQNIEAGVRIRSGDVYRKKATPALISVQNRDKYHVSCKEFSEFYRFLIAVGYRPTENYINGDTLHEALKRAKNLYILALLSEHTSTSSYANSCSLVQRVQKQQDVET